MKLFSVPTFVLLVLLSLQSVFGAGEISLKKENGSIAVTVDDKLFTRYVYKSDQRSKPILYPILGPLGLSMTRAYPVDALAKGEAKDHPHHASMWYTHGEVNGIDFWATGKGKGKLVHQDFLSIKSSSFTALNLWQNADGKTICQDERTLSFHAPSEEDRAIDISVTIKATVGNVTFGDTKEGSMGKPTPSHSSKTHICDMPTTATRLPPPRRRGTTARQTSSRASPMRLASQQQPSLTAKLCKVLEFDPTGTPTRSCILMWGRAPASS